MVTHTRLFRQNLLLLLLATAVVAGCRTPPDTLLLPEPDTVSPDVPTAVAAPSESLATYRVQAGDSVRVEVFQEPDISRIFLVSDAGTINHPLLGKVPVSGLSLEAVEARIHELLARDYFVDPKVMVALESSADHPVIVFGEVRRPGVYAIPAGGRMTLLQLVANAGGFTDIAAIDKVRIVRPQGADEEETIRVRVSDLLKGGHPEDIELQPGDVITVPRTIF